MISCLSLGSRLSLSIGPIVATGLCGDLAPVTAKLGSALNEDIDEAHLVLLLEYVQRECDPPTARQAVELARLVSKEIRHKGIRRLAEDSLRRMERLGDKGGGPVVRDRVETREIE